MKPTQEQIDDAIADMQRRREGHGGTHSEQNNFRTIEAAYRAMLVENELIKRQYEELAGAGEGVIGPQGDFVKSIIARHAREREAL
jgi:hypothetical protein